MECRACELKINGMSDMHVSHTCGLEKKWGYNGETGINPNIDNLLKEHCEKMDKMEETKTEKFLKITNCIDCPFHEVLPDPDPDDWFNDDDMKVVCTKTKRKKNEVTVACRPYNLRKESDVPEWCPL